MKPTHSAPLVHIVDDDADVRDGLAWLFDSRGYRTATWAGGEPFLQAAQVQHSSDPTDPLAPTGAHGWGLAAVLLDVRMAPLSGPVTFARLQALGCPWPVLFLTGHGDIGMAVQAVKGGAWDFLEKPFQDNELVDRVAQALAAADAFTHDSARAAQLRSALACLSPREREVLDELLKGHYNKTIADHLGITQRTVEFHRAHIFEKMGVASAVELAHQLGRLAVAPGRAAD